MFLDHDIFPIKALNIESFLEKVELAGRVYEQSGIWYSLYSKYNKDLVNNIYFNGWHVADNKPLEANEAQGKFIQEKMIEYSMDNKWLHTICGAEWHDVKGKNQIIYKMLDDILFDRY